jgi:1,4-dihydroxy-2-naphthoate polyprenyltransferase
VQSVNRWVIGARPRTLPAAVVPVVVGAASVVGEPDTIWWRAPLALVVSLALQVGVNYANDYSDGVRGTDDVRVGPARLVGGGLATPRAVKRAALASFGVAAVVGLVLVVVTTPWLLVVGIASIAAGWFYTGGSHPYGYLGLGEIFVFVFFGLVATMGTAFVVIETVTMLSFVASIPVGFMACALLVVNNLRDIPTDRQVGKHTLAVRLGDDRTRQLYTALLIGALLIALICAAVWRWPAVLTILALPLLLAPVRAVRQGATGVQLIGVLGATGRAQLVLGGLFALGLALGA